MSYIYSVILYLRKSLTMRALKLIVNWLLIAVCSAAPILYVYPVSVEKIDKIKNVDKFEKRIGRSQILEKVDVVFPFVEKVEIMTPVPLEVYYQTTSTEIPETSTEALRLIDIDLDEESLFTTENNVELSTSKESIVTTEIPTTTVEIETTTTTGVPEVTTAKIVEETTSKFSEIPTTTINVSTEALASSKTVSSSEATVNASSTERLQKSISPWKQRMLEGLTKRPKFPVAKIQRKFYVAHQYGKSKYSSRKGYKTTTQPTTTTTSTTTTDVPSTSTIPRVTKRVFSREKYSFKKRRTSTTTTTTTEVPTTTVSTTSEASTTTETYRRKFGRGKARFIKLRRTENKN